MIFFKDITVDKKELHYLLKNNVRLRWIAISGILITALIAHFILSLRFCWEPIIISCTLLTALNIYFYRSCVLTMPSDIKYYLRHAFVQNSLDVMFLTILLYYTGGISNPFQFFYIFHVIEAGILLGRYSSFYQATLSIALFEGISTLVYLGYLPYFPIEGFSLPLEEITLIVYLGWMVAFFVTMLISAYLIEFIMNMLRRKEKEIINRSKQLVDEQNRRRKIMDVVAHELKNPIATSVTMLNVITDGYMGELPQPVNNKLLKIVEKLNELQARAKNLLLLKKAEYEGGKYNPVNWSKIIIKAAEDLSEQAVNKNIDFIVNTVDDIMAVGDPGELYRVAENIISNAIRYTPKGGCITITLEYKGTWSTFIVKDTGIGIPKEDQTNIFRDFFRAKNAITFSDSGTGLGMAIVYSTLEKIQGQITFTSEEGKGTIFIVKLPLAM